MEYEYSMDPEENAIDLRLPEEFGTSLHEKLNVMFKKHQGSIYSKKIIYISEKKYWLN